MGKRWRGYIKHPLLIGFVLSFILIFFLVKFLPYYIIDEIDESEISNSGEIYYFDLDHDGNSEKLSYYHYDRIFQPTLYLYDSNDKLITLWNFSESPVKNYKVFAGDYNNNNQDEIFIFTTSSDSLFLNVLTPEKDKEPLIDRLFVDKITSIGSSFEISTIGLYNLDSQENKEFVFAVNLKNNGIVSKIYSFNFKNNILNLSEELATTVTNPVIVKDIYSDWKKEIIISNKSSEINGNSGNSQLIVLDHNLDFVFQPIDFYGVSSQVSVCPVIKNGKGLLAVLHSSLNKDVVFNDLMLFNSYGEKIQEKSLQTKSNLIITSILDSLNHIFLNSGKKIYKYSLKLDKEESYTISKSGNLQFINALDIIGDTKNEFLFKNQDEIVILSNNFKHKANIKLPKSDKLIITKVLNNHKTESISIQNGRNWYLYKMHENKAFFYSSIFYLMIFLIISFITYLIGKLGYRIKLLKKTILKTDENDLLNEIEGNLQEKFTDLKSQVEKIKVKKDNKTLDEILTKIDDTYNEVKSLSNKITAQKKKISFEDSITEIAKEKKGTIKTNLQFFSGDNFNNLKKEINEAIHASFKESLNILGTHLNENEVSVQFVHHSNHVNLIFEIEGSFLNPEIIEKNEILNNILNGVDAKLEVIGVNGFGTVVNAFIPLNQNKAELKQKFKKNKVIIAEDHDVSLFGLISMFKTKEDIEIVGTAKNGMEVLKLLESKDTDVVITDISMPGMDGIELAERLKNEYPEIKVIVFTMYLENWFVEQLINHGAQGFVSKNSRTTELVSAVRSVMDGNNFYCPQFKSKFGFKGNGNTIKQKLDSLSKNELHIVKQYAENLSKDQIAQKMELSEKTMENFIANILLKLNAGDEEEIIRIAKKQKFISE